MEDKDIVKIFLDTQEWQTFECKRAAIRPERYPKSWTTLFL